MPTTNARDDPAPNLYRCKFLRADQHAAADLQPGPRPIAMAQISSRPNALPQHANGRTSARRQGMV